MASNRSAGLLLIVRKSLFSHLLSTFVTVVSAAFGCALVMAVFNVSAQSRLAFAGGPIGFDAVLGARGSELQLVLNTIFHLETSPGNLSWDLYRKARQDPRVELAIPYAVGDNYQGHRIVGTTIQRFDAFADEGDLGLSVCPGGRWFDPERREAVIGATVADRTGLGVGDPFQPSHGVRDHGEIHDDEYLVVGVLEPTGTPSDRVLWVPIEGVLRMEGHVLRGAGEEYRAHTGEEIPEEHKELSAVLLRLRNKQAGFQLKQSLEKRGDATLAWPISQSVAELFDKLGWVNRILEIVAYLVVFMASGSILACLYNTMNERKREFAILRALGARKTTVFAVIVLESTTIAVLGSVLGYVFYGGMSYGAAAVIRHQTGVTLSLSSYHPTLLLVPVGMIFLGAAAGLLPAAKAYGTDVAEHLAR